MLRELLAATRKNLTRLFRSRLSTFAILLGPLLLIVIIGLAFGNTKLQGINVGTYIPEHTPAIDGIIESLGKGNTTFLLREYATNESCVQSVREGASHICIGFIAQNGSAARPGGPALRQNASAVNVYFYVDYSRISLVFVLLSAMNTQVSKEATEIGTEVSRSLLQQVGTINTYVAANDGLLRNLTSSSAQMSADLRTMRQSVASLDLSSPVDASRLSNVSSMAEQQKTSIERQRKEVHSQVKEAKSETAQARSELQASQQDLTTSQRRIEQSIVQIRAAESALSCQGAQVKDLTPYLADNATLEAELAKLTRPDCSVLYTARINMEDVLRQSREVQQKLQEGDRQLGEAQDRLSDFDKEFAQGSNEAVEQIDLVADQLGMLDAQMKAGNAKLQDLRATQSTLVERLDRAERALNQSAAVLGSAQQNVDKVRGSLDDVSMITPEAIVKPFTTNVQSLTGKKRQFDFLFPSLLLLVVMFVSILTASTMVMKEKASRAYFRNLILPSSLLIFFGSVLLTAVILSLIQAAIIGLIASFFFDVQLLANLPALLTILLLGVVVFSMLGMLFGFIFNSEETTTLVSIITGVLLFLFSSTLIPIESMDPVLGSIARINPFVLLETLLRHVLIFNGGVSVSFSVILLFVELAVVGTLCLFAMRRARKSY